MVQSKLVGIVDVTLCDVPCLTIITQRGLCTLKEIYLIIVARRCTDLLLLGVVPRQIRYFHIIVLHIL